MMSNKRAHVLLPEEVAHEVDKVVGPRQRSGFIVEAVEEKLRRTRLEKALAKTAGILQGHDYPQWRSSGRAGAWVRSLREESDKRPAVPRSGHKRR